MTTVKLSMEIFFPIFQKTIIYKCNIKFVISDQKDPKNYILHSHFKDGIWHFSWTFHSFLNIFRYFHFLNKNTVVLKLCNGNIQSNFNDFPAYCTENHFTYVLIWRKIFFAKLIMHLGKGQNGGILVNKGEKGPNPN